MTLNRKVRRNFPTVAFLGRSLGVLTLLFRAVYEPQPRLNRSEKEPIIQGPPSTLSRLTLVVLGTGADSGAPEGSPVKIR